MRTSVKIIAASLALAMPLAAAATHTRSFEHDGVRYSYTISTKGDTRVLRGIVENSGEPFHLEVVNGRVRGTVEGRQVSFPLREAKRLKARSEIAAR